MVATGESVAYTDKKRRVHRQEASRTQTRNRYAGNDNDVVIRFLVASMTRVTTARDCVAEGHLIRGAAMPASPCRSPEYVATPRFLSIIRESGAIRKLIQLARMPHSFN